MGGGPEHHPDLFAVAAQHPFGQRVVHIAGHGGVGAAAGGLQLGVFFHVRLVQIEHQLVGMRVAKREGHIGLAYRGALGARAHRGVAGGLQRLGKPVEAVGPDRRQDVVLVLEIAIGRHRRDAELGGQLAHGHRVRPVLGEQVLGGLAKAVPKVGDVGI